MTCRNRNPLARNASCVLTLRMIMVAILSPGATPGMFLTHDHHIADEFVAQLFGRITDK